MLFNSAIFLVFFACVYCLYWFVFKKQRLWILLLSGCLFYGCWDPRFLLLLFFTSGVDFISAKRIEASRESRIRKRWLTASVLVNLLILGFFKYYNFFAASFTELLSAFGFHATFSTLKIILPVGISFYTFQSIAYVTDVYRQKIKPERSPLRYFSFICFFPQMVAGPIERAKRMLPQFAAEKTFSTLYLQTGLNLVLYGFFKKIVIADNLALLVDEIHRNTAEYNALTLILGMMFFAIQIYTDFSGYSDIARGCAQMLGFKLSKNFYFPYFSSSLTQFWRRWHISLSSWFRDYVFIPLGGSHGSRSKQLINYLLTFVVSGIWHGANFTFMLWGFFHGIALVFEKNLRGFKLPRALSVLLVFLFVSLLFTLFRSTSISAFFLYIRLLVNLNPGNYPQIKGLVEGGFYFLLPFILFILLEVVKYRRRGLSVFAHNLATNFLVIVLIFLFAVFENAPVFIYFQF